MPAWPMPIHHTKSVMAKPQATGMLMPQMPTPVDQQIDNDRAKHRQQQPARPANRRQPAAAASAASARCALILLGDAERSRGPAGT